MAVHSQNLHYPEARKSSQVDNYHGTEVADPYRWLEDDRSPETTAWVRAENKLTAEYFAQIPYRRQMQDRLRELINYQRFSSPFRRGEYYFYSKNDGLQNQSVWYRQQGLHGEPQLLLDPNKLSADGTSRLIDFNVSKNGRYLAYTVSTGGSDWKDCYVLEIASGQLFPDHLQWLKATGIAWAGDNFYYSRYAAPEHGQELQSKNVNHKVYRHHVGTPQSEDQLVFEDAAHPQRFNLVSTTDDERFAILNIEDSGAGKDGNALYYLDLSKPGTRFVPIISEITDTKYDVIDDVGSGFLIFTNQDAPRYRVAFWDGANHAHPWRPIIPQQPNTLTDVDAIGGKLIATYIQDVASKAYVYNRDGALETEIALPGPGTAHIASGNSDDNFAFYNFTSLNTPPTVLRYDLASKSSAVFRAPTIKGFDPARYETKQVFYPSKDGTKIPLFLVYKKGLKLDGSNPTLLYGYGGFDIVNDPVFSSMRLALLEQGFVYATANLRGGGEYGEAWHQAGMKLKKQNVFDDFIAAAEWLIANGYTSPQKLAVHGVSNGGLLIGAVLNQRPDLFRAAVAQAGVMDMLRFQKFTIGWNWVSDYGTSDNAQEFKALYAYSPVHNVHAGVKYPALLITTADHDDRVVPGHSFKYAATMQENANRSNPVIIRIDTNSGHGPSSTTKQIEQGADIYSFLLWNLGVTPHFPAE